jgi:redox-sensitive bicupin YhaK (pirin superfamily)
VGKLVPSSGARSVADPNADLRYVALLANGRRYGPITRLITPWTIGELTRPFVFLDYAEIAPGSNPLIRTHPRADIATLTVVLSGKLSVRGGAGRAGVVSAGGIQWTKSGRAVWNEDGTNSGESLRMFQLWISLPAGAPNLPAGSEYLAPQEMEEDGPVRVVAGQLGRARGRIRGAPADINCFHVRLAHGQCWRYVTPQGHNVTWIAVDRGALHLQGGERVYWEQIAVLGDSGRVIEAHADGETSFMLGSAVRTSQALEDGWMPSGLGALAQHEADVGWIGAQTRGKRHR